ncbi:RagB/SusD family nutrient uptake outer membrane protein, partial [Butyricimonas sp.]|uniref:RagB/SusD family nutrient uptake outer membrane protein n=1 Tax=Butyricimonas sp. TaxID=1969738 RepID=UPI001AFCE4BF
SETIWLYGSVDDVTKYNRFIIGGQDKQPRWYMFNASTDLLTGYVGGDLRKERYIVNEYSDPTIYLTFGKYSISSTHVPSRGTEFGVAFRLAEAYLNLAEGAALSNDPVTARAAINTLREHRFTPETYTPMPELTGQDLVDYIRQERRLELCYEGFRWFDLRRYGMPSFSRDWVVNGEKVATYVIAEKDPSYTLPIPEQVLEKNKNLEQNTLANPR